MPSDELSLCGTLGAQLCHLASGSIVTVINFMDASCNGANNPRKNKACSVRGWVAGQDPSWAWRSDTPGKFGWVHCDRDRRTQSLTVNVRCKKGDLMIGYLKSYHPAMATMRVVATEIKTHKGNRGAPVFPPHVLGGGKGFRAASGESDVDSVITIDAWDPKVNESVFATKRISGLVPLAAGKTKSGAGGGVSSSEWQVVLTPAPRPASHRKLSQQQQQQQQHQPAECKNKFKIMLMACT